MKQEDVLKLVQAGFTKEDISKLFNENVDIPGGIDKKDPEPGNDKAFDFEKALSESKTFLDLATAIADLTKTVKASNILGSQQPPQNEESVDDILASVFNPKPDK